MLANCKKLLFSLIILFMSAALSMSSVAMHKRSELTVHPKEFNTFVRNFNPFLGASHLHTTSDFIYEPLIIFNEMQGNTPVFRLAKNYTMSSNLKSVLFDLRKEIKWSDGEPFDADDVIYSFNLVKQKPELDQTGINTLVTYSEKISQYQVRFHLTEANSNAPYDIVKVPIVPEHVWKSIKEPTTFANENPVGSGPFTEIDTFTPQLYIQCRNPVYWDAKSLNIDCLRVPQIANNDQFLNKVINGELDWAASFIPDIDRIYAAANPNNHYWYPPSGTQAFVVNFNTPNAAKHEALNNINFRRAFSMAIDRQTIIDIAFYGSGTINDFASGLGYAFKTWSDEKIHQKYKAYNTYDIEGSKALLKQSGFLDVNGDNYVETPSGQPFELIILSPNGWTDFNNTVQLAVEQLAEAGIRARARTPDFSVYNQAMLDGTYDVAFTGYFHGADPHTYWNSAYNSALQKGEGMPRFAMHFYKNTTLDKLLDSFYKTADKEQQLKVSHQIQSIVAENQVTIPVMSGAYMYQYNTRRFSGWWSEDNPKGRPSIWAKVPERLLHVLDLKPIK